MESAEDELEQALTNATETDVAIRDVLITDPSLLMKFHAAAHGAPPLPSLPPKNSCAISLATPGLSVHRLVISLNHYRS